MKNRETYLLKCKIKNGGFDIPAEKVEIVDSFKVEIKEEEKPAEAEIIEEQPIKEEIVEERKEEKASFILK